MGFGIPSPILTDTAPSIAWSASVEFWIGLPFFFVIFLLRRRMDIATVLSAVLGGFLIIYMWKFSPNYLAAGWQLAFSVIPFTVLRGVIGFSFGVIAYYVVETWRPRGGSIPEVFIFTIILALFYSSSFNRFNEFLVPAISAAAVVIFSAQSGVVSKVLSVKLFQVMGDASYPVYLIHPIVLDVWRHNFQYGAISLTCYLVLTVSAGYLIHVVLERPFINMGRKYKVGKGVIDRENSECRNTGGEA